MSLLVSSIFERNARSVARRAAASHGERALDHGELDALGNRLARALAGLGVEKGDRVACWCDSRLEVFPLFAGLAKRGAVFAPMNARLRAAEMAPVAALARPRLIVVDEARIDEAEPVARELDVPLVALGALGANERAHAGARATLFALAARERGERFAEPALRERDAHVVFFTSGSTGAPKGVVISHRASWLRSFQGVFVDAPEVSVCMFPLFHMAAFTLALAAWQTGGEIALASAAPDEIVRAIASRRANRFYGLPAIWARLLERGFDDAALATLRLADTGTSAVPPELVAELHARLPQCTTRIYYGSTEAGAGTALSHADAQRKPGSVGLPVPGVELALADDGEIELASPFLMDGYFENESATRAVLAGGAFRTGDLGALDDEGYLHVVGRKRDVIRSGGETIAPVEVEGVLGEHPEVLEVAVVGLPDPVWGEVVCAVAVARPGCSPTLDALVEFARPRLARFKLPRRLELVDALPRTEATRQIQRPLLVERIQARAASLRTRASRFR